VRVVEKMESFTFLSTRDERVISRALFPSRAGDIVGIMGIKAPIIHAFTFPDLFRLISRNLLAYI